MTDIGEAVAKTITATEIDDRWIEKHGGGVIGINITAIPVGEQWWYTTIEGKEARVPAEGGTIQVKNPKTGRWNNWKPKKVGRLRSSQIGELFDD